MDATLWTRSSTLWSYASPLSLLPIITFSLVYTVGLCYVTNQATSIKCDLSEGVVFFPLYLVVGGSRCGGRFRYPVIFRHPSRRAQGLRH